MGKSEVNSQAENYNYSSECVYNLVHTDDIRSIKIDFSVTGGTAQLHIYADGVLADEDISNILYATYRNLMHRFKKQIDITKGCNIYVHMDERILSVQILSEDCKEIKVSQTG